MNIYLHEFQVAAFSNQWQCHQITTTNTQIHAVFFAYSQQQQNQLLSKAAAL